MICWLLCPCNQERVAYGLSQPAWGVWGLYSSQFSELIFCRPHFFFVEPFDYIRQGHQLLRVLLMIREFVEIIGSNFPIMIILWGFQKFLIADVERSPSIPSLRYALTAKLHHPKALVFVLCWCELASKLPGLQKVNNFKHPSGWMHWTKGNVSEWWIFPSF